MIKAVIFDFFGVICPDLHRVFTKKHNIPPTIYDEVGKNVDLGLASENVYIQNLSEKTGIPILQIRKELNDEIIIDQDVVSLIKNLKKKYKIGLLSDASATLLNRILRDHNLEIYFDAIGASSEIGYTKPHQKTFQFLLGKLGVEPEEAIFIDDSQSNIRGAEQIGIKGLRYTGAVSLKESLSKLL